VCVCGVRERLFWLFKCVFWRGPPPEVGGDTAIMSRVTYE